MNQVPVRCRVGRDGRKQLPKCLCPACGKRVVDTSSPELKNATRIFLRPSGTADLYIECPHCHKILGITIRTLHNAISAGDGILPVPSD